MTLSIRNQFASVAAAILCAFVTVGVSIAPAVTSATSLVA